LYKRFVNLTFNRLYKACQLEITSIALPVIWLLTAIHDSVYTCTGPQIRLYFDLLPLIYVNSCHVQ